MRLRDMTDADRPAVAALHVASWREVYAHLLPPDYAAAGLARDMAAHWSGRVLAAGDFVLLAGQGDALAGFVAVRDGADPLIDNLHVRAGRRAGGIGPGLMAAAARRLLAAGRRTAHLDVRVGNARALRFYRRLGGVSGETIQDDIFGHPARSIHLRWPDLGDLVARASPLH